MIVFVAVLVIQ